LVSAPLFVSPVTQPHSPDIRGLPAWRRLPWCSCSPSHSLAKRPASAKEIEMDLTPLHLTPAGLLHTSPASSW
jgi:hypothetical protein